MRFVYTLQRSTVGLIALALSACGGGVSLYSGNVGVGVGVGPGGGSSFDRTPPSVSIVVPSGPVRRGDTLRVAAAASDASGIESVSFYRVDTAGPVWLGSVGGPAYEWLVAVPNDGRLSLSLFAEARDNAGNRADSSIVTVNLLP